MPQMAPIMWMSLFLTFSCLFLFTMIKISNTKNLNMSSKTKINEINSTEMNYNSMNWKW